MEPSSNRTRQNGTIARPDERGRREPTDVGDLARVRRTPCDIFTRSATTFKYDLLRNMFQGITETGFTTFVLLVAIRVFHAPESLKAILSGAEHLGMFLTFVSFGLFLRFSMSATRLSAVYFFLEAFLLFLTALSDTLMEFVVAILCAKVIYRQYTPLMTQVYAENYSHKTRGKRLSVVLVASAMVGIGFSKLGGYWLDLDLHNYTWIFFSMAAASMFCGWSLSRIPSSRVKNNATPKLLQFSYLWKDPLFGKMVLAWTLLGFGNFMTLPMRIEYLANERYGLSLSNQTVVLITAILPMVARIASMSIWGLLFDRVRFIPLRSLNNLFWILGLFCFFNFTNLWLIGLGSILIGIGMGGGFVIWNLWVTKIAPPDKAGAYMSVHTSISGLQGMLSPCVGYAILSLPHMTPAVVGWVGILLSIASLALFASHWKDTRIT